jgi:cell division protease FtsH
VWLVAGAIFIALALNLPGAGSHEVAFSRFLQLSDEGRVAKVTISQQTIQAELKGTGKQPGETVRSALPTEYQTNDLVERLRKSGAEVEAQPPSPWSAALVGLLPFLLLGVFWYFFVLRRARQQLGGSPLSFGSFGRNRAKLYDRTDMKTTFADVAGVDEVEAELTELVDYLRRPEKYERIGARIPKGVLLVGPPGTGKTLLARAIAGEADVPFFYISASEFIELFVGLGAARVRDLFEQARERAPAIVFIDEIDAIGQTRAGGAGFGVGGHQEQEQTLQQLLTEMDGFAPNTGVIIVAASNRPEVLDPALLRPGRFDRQIQVNLPDIQGRRDILAIHARGVNLEPDVDLRTVARRTPGFSGAMLANVINEAALLAGRRGKDRVGRDEIEEAIDRVIAGLERRSQVLSEQERRIVAYHELGHAVVAHLVEHADPVHRVSIIPRGIGALGHTQQLPEEERYLMSEPELRDRIAVLLGGRAAEEVVFGFPTTGAEDDLRKATEIARRMVTEFGMSAKLGPINITEGQSRFLSPLARRGDDVSDHTETVIDSEVRTILTEAHEKAAQVLMRVRTELDVLADLLLERETLERPDLEKHLGARHTARPAEDQDSDETPTMGRAAG